MKLWRYLVLALAITACSPDNQAPGQGALEELRGQWLVINYWAKWCTPCIKEIPELNALAAARPDIQVLGVNFDGATGDELAQQEKEFQVAFRTLAADPAQALGIERPKVLPTTLLVDPTGAVATILVGPQTLESLENSLASAGSEAPQRRP